MAIDALSTLRRMLNQPKEVSLMRSLSQLEQEILQLPIELRISVVFLK